MYTYFITRHDDYSSTTLDNFVKLTLFFDFFNLIF